MYYSNKLKAHTAKFPRFIYLFIYLFINRTFQHGGHLDLGSE